MHHNAAYTSRPTNGLSNSKMRQSRQIRNPLQLLKLDGRQCSGRMRCRQMDHRHGTAYPPRVVRRWRRRGWRCEGMSCRRTCAACGTTSTPWRDGRPSPSTPSSRPTWRAESAGCAPHPSPLPRVLHATPKAETANSSSSLIPVACPSTECFSGRPLGSSASQTSSTFR